MNIPKVFVLILSYNGTKWLKDCLPTVLNMDYLNYEVVVIDNGSSDGTEDYVHKNFLQVHVLALKPNRGYAGGFAAGLEYAANLGADYFLVMNNDTKIDSHALTALVDAAESLDRAGFVTGKVYYHDHPDTFQTTGRNEHPVVWTGRHIGLLEKDTGQYDQIAERVFIDDVYTLVSRKLYDEIGGYDPQFYLQCEELDWQLRAKKAGWKIYYTPHARIWHRVSATTGGTDSAINNYFLERSRIIVMAKHGSAGRITRYVVSSGAQALYRLMGAALRLNYRTFKPRLARLLGIGAGIMWLIHHRPMKAVPGLILSLST